MSGLLGAFSGRMDDHVAAFFAGEVRSFRAIFQPMDRLVRELHRFDCAVGGLHGNRLRAGIYPLELSVGGSRDPDSAVMSVEF